MRSPAAPNPYQTAQAQQTSDTGAGITQSILGNPNTFTPYGSQTYSIAGYEQIPGANGQMISVPRYNMTQSLSPDQQKLMGLQTQGQYNLGQTAVEQSAKLREHLNKPMDTAGLGNWGQIRQDQGATDRPAIEAAMMGRFNADSTRQNAAQEANLAARGMNVGTQGWGQVKEQQDRARTDATQQAYLASGAESRAAQDAYNQASGQMGQQRGQQLQEKMAIRNQPINEISALLAGGQVTLPQFQQYQSQGVNAAPIGQYIGQNFAQNSANTNAFNSGLFGIAGLGGQALGRRLG